VVLVVEKAAVESEADMKFLVGPVDCAYQCV